jgi:ElaB/YqjD/DUF883 family membrane-anchored ribosome-binding protein
VAGAHARGSAAHAIVGIRVAGFRSKGAINMARNGTTRAMEDRLDALKDSVRNLVDAGSEKLGSMKDTVVSSSKTGIHRAGSLIKDHPIIAIGIAFGIGYFAMRMLRR